jgi:hypothetical protein
MSTTSRGGRVSGFEGVSPAVLDAWRAAQQRPRLLEDPGPDWLTSEDLGKLWGVSRGRAQEQVRGMVRQGLVEVGRRSIILPSGRAYPTPVYRLIEPKAKRGRP